MPVPSSSPGWEAGLAPLSPPTKAEKVGMGRNLGHQRSNVHFHPAPGFAWHVGTQIIIMQSATCPKFSFRLSHRAIGSQARSSPPLPPSRAPLSLPSVYFDPNWFLPSPTCLVDNTHLPWVRACKKPRNKWEKCTNKQRGGCEAAAGYDSRPNFPKPSLASRGWSSSTSLEHTGERGGPCWALGADLHLPAKALP